jgi:hypothetical protein
MIYNSYHTAYTRCNSNADNIYNKFWNILVFDSVSDVFMKEEYAESSSE